MVRDIPSVLERLAWMEREQIWPNGLRYLWTDAFGLVLLVSLFEELGEQRYLDDADRLLAEVDRVLGRPHGLRIGEAPDRDGQYYHYLAMWLFALSRLARHRPACRERAIDLARDIHSRFVQPGVGVFWKMREDLSGPYPGYEQNLGALDPFSGYVVYRLLDPEQTALAREIADMGVLVEQSYSTLYIPQDLGLGMMLWASHFFPDETWARLQRERSLTTLDVMWIDVPGYFCRQPGAPDVKFAFTNYGAAIGLQAVDAWPERVRHLHEFFRTYRSEDHYDTDAITHVMACCSHFPGLLLADAVRD